jgi:hypothetical protein
MNIFSSFSLAVIIVMPFGTLLDRSIPVDGMPYYFDFTTKPKSFQGTVFP